MSRIVAALLVSLALAGPGTAEPPKRVLRVAADPNNLPFSNERGEGFENRIARLLARELGAELKYEWRAQRRGFFREVFKEGDCDLVLGVPAGFERCLTTAPYYRSSYAFVWRKERRLGLQSFDDPALRKLKIGVQLVGDDGANTPPAHALAARGLVENLVGFTVYGDYAEESPPARIIKAVADGEIDVAAAWGPLAGYFARRQKAELELALIRPEADRSGQPLAFAIAVGVRRGHKALRDEVDAALKGKRPEIEKILDEFGVPRLPPAAPKPGR